MTDIATSHERLDHARDHLAAAERALTAQAPNVAGLHAAVDGLIQLTTTLTDLVATLIRQAPATLGHSDGPALSELLADLRALHGGLANGPLLLAPARDDLRHLLTSQHVAGAGCGADGGAAA